jgi:hypothetical protein
MIGVVGGVRRSVENTWEWIKNELMLKQKPELDKKIDQMLQPPKLKRIMQKYLGIGKSLGGKLGAIGRGLSIGKGLKAMRKLF